MQRAKLTSQVSQSLRRRNFVVKGVLGLLISTSAFAQSWAPDKPQFPSLDRSVNRLKGFRLLVPSRLELDSATGPEIFSGNLSHSVDLGMRFAGSGLSDSFELPVIERTLQQLWRAEVPKELGTSALDVKLEILGTDGSRAILNQVDQPQSVIRVEIVPLDPVVLSETDEMTTFEGGATLRLYLDQVLAAGTYRGRLLVTIHQF